MRPHHHNPGLDQIAGKPKAARYRLLRMCCELNTVATKNSLADLRGGCYRLALRVSLARSLSKASKSACSQPLHSFPCHCRRGRAKLAAPSLQRGNKCDTNRNASTGPNCYSGRPRRPADCKRSHEGQMMVRNIGRAMAWFTLVAIIVLSLVPPGARPITFMAHKIEHASIFLFDGVAFGIAYCGYAWLSSIVAVIFCAGIELAQLTIPGRHARLSDFFVDAIAICVGIFAGSTLIRMRPHREAIIASRSAK